MADRGLYNLVNPKHHATCMRLLVNLTRTRALLQVALLDRMTFRILVTCVAALSAFSASSEARAQTYPSAPVRVIVPFPAGGGNDSMGRILAQKLTDSFGRQFIVENRGGANGQIGSEIVAEAPKDGYPRLVNGPNFVPSPSLYAKPLYDP